jgi:hypothetical protein
MTVIAMWAHSRSKSTAFLRMMIARGDVVVVHEPLLRLTGAGEVSLPSADGGQTLVRSEKELLHCLTLLGRAGPVFMKEVLDYRYNCLFDHPAEMAAITHTFIVRDPRPTISSHYAMKPTVTSAEIGYENLHELFELAWETTGRQPLVVRSEQLMAEPALVIEAYCDYAGLPYLPDALSWDPSDRPEWQQHQDWHVDAINSSGFQDHKNTYAATVDNNAVLKSFYDYHYPFYERIVRHADRWEHS